MDVTLCQMCKEPIWNFVCVDCIANDVRQWLPTQHTKGFKTFHRLFTKHFDYNYVDARTYKYCIHCRNLITVPICPYCYTNEVYQWIRTRDGNLASLFTTVFKFDFEGAGHKEYMALEGFMPIEEDSNEKLDEGICEVCECYSSNLREVEGKWVCESCLEA